MTPNTVTKSILTFALLAVVAWLACSPTFYNEAIASAYFAFTLGGVLIIHFRVRPAWIDAGLVVAGAVALALVDFGLLHYKRTLLCWLAFAGIASLAILGTRAIWSEGEARKTYLLCFVPAACFAASEYFASNLLDLTGKLHPRIWDLYLYAFDASLRVQIPFTIGRWFASWPALRTVSLLCYASLSFPIALIYAGKVLRIRGRAFYCFLAFVATGPVGVLFYNLFPAAGPVHLFGEDFPWRPLSTEQISRLFLEPVPIDGFRNAIPSLHMTWVLLAWWYSRGMSRWERAVAMVFLVFTVLATMGSGEHYAIDLVLAFPYALLIEAIFSDALSWKNSKRWRAVLFGLASILVWFAGLKFTPHVFWITPILPWVLCVATVLVSIYLEWPLQSAALSEPDAETTAEPVLAES